MFQNDTKIAEENTKWLIYQQETKVRFPPSPPINDPRRSEKGHKS